MKEEIKRIIDRVVKDIEGIDFRLSKGSLRKIVASGVDEGVVHSMIVHILYDYGAGIKSRFMREDEILEVRKSIDETWTLLSPYLTNEDKTGLAILIWEMTSNWIKRAEELAMYEVASNITKIID